MAPVSTEKLDAFVEAWNEPDVEKRDQLLALALAENGQFSDGHNRATGRDAVSVLIGETLAEVPGRKLQRGLALERLGGPNGFRWRLTYPDRPEVSGRALVRAGDDGLLTSVVAVNDPEVSASETASPHGFRAWMFANALALGGLFVFAIYLVLRLQAQRFYDNFGVSPEDAGFGSVELVLRQATDVLVTFAGAGLLWSVFYLVGMVPWMYVTGVHRAYHDNTSKYPFVIGLGLSFVSAALILLPLWGGWEWWLVIPGVLLFLALLCAPTWIYPDSADVRRRVREPLQRWAIFVLVFGTVVMGLATFVFSGIERADQDAAFVRDGGWATDEDYPWQARPVEVRWVGDRAPYALPACMALTYLGEANGLALVYDPRGEGRLLRLPLSDVRLLFSAPDRCYG